MLLRQVPKARNYLKRAWTIPWNTEDAEDLEKCWLLLAATYMSVKIKIYFFETKINFFLRMENMTKPKSAVKNVLIITKVVLKPMNLWVLY